jgi:hypothetical protein
MRYLTFKDKVCCIHGGIVTFSGSGSKVFVNGSSVLTFKDLTGAQITGCPIPVTQTSKPCTMVVAITAGVGRALKAGEDQDAAPLLESLAFQTDGLPVGGSRPMSPLVELPSLGEE